MERVKRRKIALSAWRNCVCSV